MKNLKIFFSVLILATLFIGLFQNSQNKESGFEQTEFLFDAPCSITVFSRKDKNAVSKAFDEALRIHKLSDFFDPDSDVSKINIAKGGESVTVDSFVIDMLELAEEIFKSSNGAFDISLAPVCMLWKFDTQNPVPPTDEQIAAALKHTGNDRLLLNKSLSTVTKQSSETKIDLGGIAKGFAADRAAEVLTKNNVSSAIIDFGGNIITIGKNPKKADGMWQIGLQKPFAQTGEYSKILTVGPSSIATSGSYQRNFVYDGNLYHHIIDPKTGKPSVQEFSSVTVTARNSALADCLGTAIFVLGEEKGLALAKQYGASLEFLK